MNIEIHGMTGWVGHNSSSLDPDQPDVACVVDGALTSQSDCAICASKEP